MPFKSRAQLRACYKTRGFGHKVDCDEWLSKTESIECLPEKVAPLKCRRKRKNEIIKGKVKTGPRGGKYFVIQEVGPRGKVYEMKVYI